MPEIRLSGSTRGEWVAPQVLPSLLLYRPILLVGGVAVDRLVRRNEASAQFGFIYDPHREHYYRNRLLEKPAEPRCQQTDLPDLRSSV